MWASNTSGEGESPYIFALQDDGKLVLRDKYNKVIWNNVS